MNRFPQTLRRTVLHVPRRRGDEPDYLIGVGSELLCSPQARG